MENIVRESTLVEDINTIDLPDYVKERLLDKLHREYVPVDEVKSVIKSEQASWDCRMAEMRHSLDAKLIEYDDATTTLIRAISVMADALLKVRRNTEGSYANR